MQRAIIERYKVIDRKSPDYKVIVVYNEANGRYYPFGLPIRNLEGYATDTVEMERRKFKPLPPPEKISVIFRVPVSFESEYKQIHCYSLKDFREKIKRIKKQTGWFYCGICGASIFHKWFHKILKPIEIVE